MNPFLSKSAVLALFVLPLFSCNPSPSSESRNPAKPVQWTFDQGEARVRPVVGKKGMIVADDKIAASWGASILRKGGNAVDAAVATAFAMAVTRPHYASLGGGGFMIYCPAPGEDGKKRDCHALDYRERAPRKATVDMYMKDGKPRTDLSQDGALASGVPGVTAGLLRALDNWGTKSRSEVLKRPIQLANGGFRFTGFMNYWANKRWSVMNDEAKRVLGCRPSGTTIPESACATGRWFIQKDLAAVLRTIEASGAGGFYRGWVGQKIARGIQKAGGILDERDLIDYVTVTRKPVTGIYRGAEIVSMPPPSAGGANLIQMLQFTEMADRRGELADGMGSSRAIHAMAHAMSLAFSDRAIHFGDMDKVDVPLAKLLSPKHLQQRWEDTFKFARKAEVAASDIPSGLDNDAHTTHFSVIDAAGNAVSVTTTVNYYYGSGFMPPGTGIVMNNEMDDFSVQPGVPNTFGLVGSKANAVAAGKRPLSSMSPTIVRDEKGRARIVIGAAGGPRITTSVYQTLVNRLRFNIPLTDAMAAPRFHYQWKPDVLFMEQHLFPSEVRNRLSEFRYHLKDTRSVATMHGLERYPETGEVWGVADPRGEGTSVAE